MGEKGETTGVGDGLFLYEESSEAAGSEAASHLEEALVPFALGEEWYAVDIADVVEVVESPPVTRLPGLPDFISGVTSLRGTIISVTDVSRLLGLGGSSPTPTRRLVVIRAAGRTTGLMVDSVGEILGVAPDRVQPRLLTIRGGGVDYVRGEAKLPDGRLLAVLDLEKLMSSEEMQFAE
ncbi:chemotaxis protein CheW [bacterium]|nr:chemotaxis protein CheW [bacterium]